MIIQSKTKDVHTRYEHITVNTLRTVHLPDILMTLFFKACVYCSTNITYNVRFDYILGVNIVGLMVYHVISFHRVTLPESTKLD